MVFEIKEDSGSMDILIRLVFSPEPSSVFPHAGYRHKRLVVLRLWPFKKSSRKTDY